MTTRVINLTGYGHITHVRRSPARYLGLSGRSSCSAPEPVHDGFTLADLVPFNAKHNEANGEDDHDGTDDNRSWSCGVEGPTNDAGR